jgi:SepF-like predicted cell division protein (DUF552 family)
VRSLFRRKQNDELSNEISTGRLFPSLGVFSPVAETSEPNPSKELRMLRELESIFVRSKKLESLADVPYVVDEIKDGNIELRRIIERIKSATKGYQSDIALVNDGCMIVTPAFVKL